MKKKSFTLVEIMIVIAIIAILAAIAVPSFKEAQRQHLRQKFTIIQDGKTFNDLVIANGYDEGWYKDRKGVSIKFEGAYRIYKSTSAIDSSPSFTQTTTW